MESPEVYHLIARRIRRGLVIFTLLWSASIGVCIIALIFPGSRPWVAAACVTSIYLYWGRDHVEKRNTSAIKVAENPQLIYWAHPASGLQDFVEKDITNCAAVMLHLQDGTEFEADLPPDQMRTFIDWLVEKNPSVRLGAYDEEEGELVRRLRGIE